MKKVLCYTEIRVQKTCEIGIAAADPRGACVPLKCHPDNKE